MCPIDYRLRPATEADRSAAYAIYRDAMRPYVEPMWPWRDEFQRARFDESFTPGRSSIVEVAGEFAGVVIAELRPDELFLSEIQLAPAFRRRGIGTAVVSGLAARARAAGVPVSLHVLHSNPDAMRFYAGLGFVEVERAAAWSTLSLVPTQPC